MAEAAWMIGSPEPSLKFVTKCGTHTDAHRVCIAVKFVGMNNIYLSIIQQFSFVWLANVSSLIFSPLAFVD